MSINIADFVLHIDESLTVDELKTLEEHIHKMGGVVSACNLDEQPHLISVTYNTEKLTSHEILEKVEREGVHAELIGL